MKNLWAFAILLSLVKVAVVLLLNYPDAVGLFDDDAYYYFGIAKHIALGNGSTFNGIDATNGYHPLWLLLLVPIFLIAEGHTALVAVTILSSAIFVLSVYQIDRITRLTNQPKLLTICTAPLLVLGVTGPAFWFSGMETGILLFCLLWLAHTFIRTQGLVQPWFTTKHAFVLGGMMALAIMARLDTIFAMFLLGIVALVSWHRAQRPWIRLGLATASVPAVIIGVYIVINVALFETPLPVSGQAKALGGNFNPNTLLQFLVSPVLFGINTMLGLIAFLVSVSALMLAKSDPLGLLARFGVIIFAGGVITVFYYSVTSSWHLWPWYFSSAPLAIALAGPVLLRRLRHIPAYSATVVLILILATIVATSVRSLRGGILRSAYIEAGPEFANLISKVTPSNALVAMGDRAGSVGYHLSRPLIHLEGLVNSAEYLEALAHGDVLSFINAEGVTFYARGDADPGAPDVNNPGCSRFTEPQQGGGNKFTIVVCEDDRVITLPLRDHTYYRLWHYRSGLNPEK